MTRANATNWERWLLKGAQAAGFASDQWAFPRVVQRIERRLGVSATCDIDHGCCARCGMPQRLAPLECDESAIQHGVQQTGRG